MKQSIESQRLRIVLSDEILTLLPSAAVSTSGRSEPKDTASTASAAPMSRRKLSIHIIGRGPREDASAASAASARNNRAGVVAFGGVGLDTSREQKSGGVGSGGVVLDFVESAALFPKSHHIDVIEAFRSKLFIYPAAPPEDK